nr:hypothetical protein [uncultured Flavobacterium sp.]
MKKLLAYIPLLLFTALPAYAFQDDEAALEPDYTINDTIYEEAPSVAEPNDYIAEPPTYKNRTFGNGFKEKYNDSDFDYTVKKAPDNFFTRFLGSVRDFFRNLFSIGPKSGKSVSFLVIFLKIMGILIITGLVVVIIIGFVRGSFSGFFGKKSAKMAPEGETVEDVLNTDFAGLILKTENESDYRLAVRYYYLWLLQHLTNRGIIKWNTDKTNTDYYYEINDTNIRTDFKYLSYVYDYIWYGEFAIDNTAYLKAKNAFRKTLNTI